jgi:hypothetical protein
MEDILVYEEKLADDSSLIASINELIDFIIREKKFQFKKEDFSFDIERLKEMNVLHEKEGVLKINDSAFFFSRFIDFYFNKFSFTISDDVDKAFAFTNEIEHELDTEGYRPGVSEFFRSIRKFTIFIIHKSYKSDFSAYTKNLSKEISGQTLYHFLNSYCNILPFITSPVGIIYENVKHLMNQVTDPSVRWNGNIGEIRSSIVSYCQIDPEKGEVLLEYAIEQIEPMHDVNSAILQGMYLNRGAVFWPKLEELSKNENWRLSVLLGLSSLKPQTEEEGKEFFNLTCSLNSPTEVELFNLPQILVSIVNAAIVSEEIKINCFKELERHITNSNQNLRLRVLSEISFINGFDDERINLMKKLIETPDFDKEQINSIAHVFVNNKSLKGFIELVHLYGSKYRLDFNAEIFSSAFHHFRNDQPENLSIELIKLLTHDLGEIRFIGGRILNYLTPHRGHFIFQTNILDLDALTQYKLWMSIFGETKEPGVSIPMLLPLLQSSFSFVKEAFIGRMEILTEEYGSSVAETLEKELDLNIPENLKTLDRVKKYADDFWNEISKKRNVKEFNPLYTQSELYTLHSTNYNKSFNKSFSENVHKGSTFLQFATTVILAKGGGWKHEKHSKVEKLGQVNTSFQLPRSYFISPESFDVNFRKNYIKNWKNILEKWEAIISS